MKRATEKQKRLKKLLSENVGNKKCKTKGELLLKAGYSKSMSETPQKAMAGKAIKEHTDKLLKLIDDRRRWALTAMTQKKLKDSAARDLAYINDSLTKSHQLLSGEDTERVGGVLLTSEQRARIAEEETNRQKNVN